VKFEKNLLSIGVLMGESSGAFTCRVSSWRGGGESNGEALVEVGGVVDSLHLRLERRRDLLLHQRLPINRRKERVALDGVSAIFAVAKTARRVAHKQLRDRQTGNGGGGGGPTERTTDWDSGERYSGT
jgi:hypothetical protein